MLVLRMTLGTTIAAHGAQKLFGWFGGRGPSGTAAGFEKGGFPLPMASAIAAGVCEGAGGALLVAGAATPLGGVMVLGAMATAADTHREKGLFSSNGGFELPLLIGAGALALALTGPGELSVDRLAGVEPPGWLAPLMAAAAVGSSVALSRVRRASLATRSTSHGAQPAVRSAAAARPSRPHSGKPQHEAHDVEDSLRQYVHSLDESPVPPATSPGDPS